VNQFNGDIEIEIKEIQVEMERFREHLNRENE